MRFCAGPWAGQKARALCAEDGFIGQALRRDRSISVFASSADFLADDNVLAALGFWVGEPRMPAACVHPECIIQR